MALQQNLGLGAAAALQVVIRQPKLLSYKIESNLPHLLRFLDGYMGEEGAGRRLVRAQPSLGTVTTLEAKRGVGNLAARGYSQQEIQCIINKHPDFLNLDLGSPLQQQKLKWIEHVLPWTVDEFLDKPSYFTVSTGRLAARLALLQECRLQPGATPGVLVVLNDSRFMESVRSRVARQGRELPWASWAGWEEKWLGTEEGREWGFPPLKD